MAGLLGEGDGTAVWAYRIVTIIRHGKGVAWLAYVGVQSCTYGQNGMHRAEYSRELCTAAGRKCSKPIVKYSKEAV